MHSITCLYIVMYFLYIYENELDNGIVSLERDSGVYGI